MTGDFSIILAVCLVSALASAALENVRVFNMERAPLPEAHNSNGPVTVTVAMQQKISTVGPRFVGVTLDSGLIRANWSTLDLNSKKVQNMARAIVPTFLRIGGTSADETTYNFGNGTVTKSGLQDSEFYMSAQQWDAANNFVRDVGWEFVFDLNSMKRYANGSWDPDNARQLLKYSDERNYTIVGFQLGNEYDMRQTPTPDQLAKDVTSLQNVLAEYPNYYSSFITGPETATGMTDHYSKFLSAGGAQVVRAASFHQYYFAGSGARLSYFTDVNRMNGLVSELDVVMRETRLINPDLPVWLSETSTSWGGGTNNASNRFVAAFLWLDKLGVCAEAGLEAVIRQTFYGGYYALIDNDMNPYPDYWLTVLYKRIVKGPVFKATGRSDVRVYSACANKDNFKPGSLVVYMLNPNNYSVTFDLPQFNSQPRLIYNMTAGDSDGLVSRYVALNGVKLELVNDDLPKLEPKMVSSGAVDMSPYSYIFVVFPEARVAICME